MSKVKYEKRIAPVENNKDKQKTYAEEMDRYKKAIHEDFFFEALLIDYAMLEDRLRSFLYHSAFIADRQTPKIWKKTSPYLKEFVSTYKRGKENETLGIMTISGKIKLVRSILLWASETTENCDNDRFKKTLKSRYESLDIGALLETLDLVEEWCRYRNEVIHSLLNKNITSLNEKLEEETIAGMKYARFIDAQIRILKKNDRIRRSVNAPKEKTRLRLGGFYGEKTK